MVSPGVVAGFAVIDITVLAEAAYAVREYTRHHPREGGPRKGDSSG